MKHLVLMLLVLSACGGSWSNKDIEFATALPHRDDLKSKIPDTGTSTSPLTGVSTRRDGLDVGDPSKAYGDAVGASRTFNGILDFLLGVLDSVRQVPPTSRTELSRTWGPFPDSNNPGYEFKVTIAEGEPTDGGAGTLFSWSLAAHQTNGDFFDVVTGQFDPSVSVKKGSGAMTMHVTNFRDKLKVDDMFKKIDQIDVVYNTGANPVTVDMRFALAAGNDAGISAIGYSYKENADKSGNMVYQVRTTSADLTVLDTHAGWLSTGEGRALQRVTEGTYQGFSLSECWNTSFKVTLYAEGWDGGVTHGNAANCPVISGL